MIEHTAVTAFEVRQRRYQLGDISDGERERERERESSACQLFGSDRFGIVDSNS